MSTPTRNDREPAPIDRFVDEGGKGTIKIDGAHLQKEKADRARQGPPPTVPAEFTPDMAPGRYQLATLWGGPADGCEARVRRGALEHRVAVPRAEGAGRVGEALAPDGKTRQAIVGGDYGMAVYLRTDRRADDGQAIYEFDRSE